MPKSKLAYFPDTDTDVYEYLSRFNFSEWVRVKARNEMVRIKTGLDPEITGLIEKIIETKLAGRTLATSQTVIHSKEILNLEQFF